MSSTQAGMALWQGISSSGNHIILCNGPKPSRRDLVSPFLFRKKPLLHRPYSSRVEVSPSGRLSSLAFKSLLIIFPLLEFYRHR